MINLRSIRKGLIKPLPVGFRDLGVQAWAEFVTCERHLRGCWKARRYRGRTGMALHLGSGDHPKSGWINVDLNPIADLTLDLRQRLPFANNSFAIIYSEHVLEHFRYPRDVTNLLGELYRVLQPGGIHSFAVPDGEKELRYYVKRDDPEVLQAHVKWHPCWCSTPMDHVNYCMRQDGEHLWCYDEESLRMLLESAGFVAIARREFDPALDQEIRRLGSLYMECRKPEIGAPFIKQTTRRMAASADAGGRAAEQAAGD